LYQDINQESNFQATNNQPTNNHNLRIIEYKNINNIYYYLEKTFGRTITPIEMNKLFDWQKWFSDDVIKYAIDRTVLNGARALSYTETIINSWHDKGYKTLEDCKNENKREDKPVQKDVFDYDWLNEEG
jgi:DnaD/phage-associated family protein